ncbi:MAG: MarR family winged helix-turn-helix transcriptional regulator [Eubacteriales bacterium]
MDKRYDTLDTINKLIWNFRDIAHTMHHISEGKGSQKRVLIVLRENNGMTQKELTEHLGIRPGSVSEVLGKLEAGGLIVRTPGRDDRRTTDIRLTAEGEILAEEAYRKRMERHRQMFEALSGEERNTLLRLLEKVNTDWDRKYRGEEGE